MNYISKSSCCGLPLVHIAIIGDGNNKRGIAKGWIAIGDISFGVLFSFGGVAIGGIAIGGLSLGILSIAGVALGLFALGGLAVGVYAIGGAAIAIYSAYGGFAAAFKYAIGGAAFAEQANTELAETIIHNSRFFKIGESMIKHSRWALVLVIIPIIFNILKMKKRIAKK